jgi:LysR family hydrogen peroxide-inducible transcriptional activator
MELHQLRYFLAVARDGNFSRAAERCNVSQPSLSQQIQKLEEELGEKLFSRLKRKTVLTAAGEALVPRATRILGDVETARQEVADASRLVRGRVIVGLLPTIAPYLLPPMLLLAAKRCPAVEVVIHEEPTARLLQLAAGCEIDLAVLSSIPPDERFIVEKLHDEELLLALPPGHDLVARRSVRMEDLDGERFILMKEGHCLGDQALRICSRHDLQPQVVFRSSQLETIQALITAGAGISLIPEMARQTGRAKSPLYRSLAHPRPTRAINVAWRKEQHHSRAVLEIVRLLREAAEKMARG